MFPPPWTLLNALRNLLSRQKTPAPAGYGKAYAAWFRLSCWFKLFSITHQRNFQNLACSNCFTTSGCCLLPLNALSLQAQLTVSFYNSFIIYAFMHESIPLSLLLLKAICSFTKAPSEAYNPSTIQMDRTFCKANHQWILRCSENHWTSH